MTSRAPETFNVCGELPTGTTLLEASAGTGKTFTIAALATRYVAEGVATLPELLLVTFGRAATAELRDRVRERLVMTERALRDPASREAEDDVVRHLADVDDEERGRRRARLTRALAEVDAATIATTHAFCQQMLAGLGIVGDTDADAVLLPDVADLRDEVVDDLYLREYSASEAPELTVAVARRVAHEAISDHHAALEPADLESAGALAATSEAAHRYRFARAVRAEMALRKRQRKLVDYDDLIVHLRDALAHPVDGKAAAERVRARYRVVMVDEFQDTDPVQWEVLRLAFHGHRTLVLIGDPKQAIYAFRGADVVTYLEAAEVATTTATLARSWRADEPLLRGVDHLLGGAELGDPRIVVRQVDAAHTEPRIDGAHPLRLRVLPRALLPKGYKGLPSVRDVRAAIAADVAADVVAQLDAGVKLRTSRGWEPLAPGDIAVIARRNEDATSVREALAAAGVPAVQSALTSVFATPAAHQWLTLLQALEQPGRSVRVATAALTPFVGWDARTLPLADEDERDRLSERVREWAHVLTTRGVAALLEVVTTAGLAERVLRTDGGERLLTDLRHVGQVLHAATATESLGPSALGDWLARHVDEAGEDFAEERSRRLESDAAAVQLMTVHASKGLEFPVVYVPFAWDRWDGREPDVAMYHDENGRRSLDVGGPGTPAWEDHCARHLAEEQGEDLRLLYVAATRARSQVVLTWAPSANSKSGALSRFLFGRGSSSDVGPVPVTVDLPKDDAALVALQELAERSGGDVVVEPITSLVERGAVRWTPPAERPGPLGLARLDRTMDVAWRRTSYSALTAAAHDLVYDAAGGVSSEPETAGVQDEVDVAVDAQPPADLFAVLSDVPSPMADLPAGTSFGTLVHRILETVDTSAPDLDAELLGRCTEATRLRDIDPKALAAGLGPVLATPLGPLAGGAALRDIVPSDRLAELDFELPLAGGDEPGGHGPRRRGAQLGDVAGLLREHLPADDPFAGYADRLAGPLLLGERLRGYLTGSLDAVLRVRVDGVPRYLVVDYKTNWLGPPGEPLTTWHYRPAVMVEAMVAAHYPLQLLLYSAALHRFLRWRQPGYVPETHLGGGLYLFVRGMAGPSTPVMDDAPTGVLGWRPPAALVTDLSALLEEGS